MSVISQKWDIKSAFEHFVNIQVVGQANVDGVTEYDSNCPWCPGSKNSFKTRPETGRFIHIRGCGKHGDIIDLLTDPIVGMSRQEALIEADVVGIQFADQDPIEKHTSSADSAPPVKWSEAAEIILKRAERYLWNPNKSDALRSLEYLRGRGLKDETIKEARLGCVPLQKDGQWYRGSFEEWGLDPELLKPEQVAKGGVSVADGVLIPYFVGGVIWKLEIKRPWADRMPKGQVMGSKDPLYNVDGVQYGEIAMITESVIDALSVKQEAGDLVNVVATGGTPKCRAMRWISELMSTPSFVLQSFDSDAAGDAAAETWIDLLMAIPDSKIGTDTFDHLADFKVERWPLVLWDDPNELLQQQLKGESDGFTLREWVQLGVDLAQHDMQQDMNPLAREVQEEVEVQFDPFEDGSTPDTDVPPLPEDVQTSPGKLADAFRQAVEVLGGPDVVALTKHDGHSLSEHYPTVIRPYTPRTLPALPRTACPHTSVVYSPVDARGVSKYVSSAPCKGKPLADGWCAEHHNSQVLLEVGAKLGYPEILKLGKFGGRGILEGVACWEVCAEKITPEHAELDTRAIKARFGI